MTISRIIDELVDDEVSLTKPLLKTKVLASRLGSINLNNWVSKELNGYNTQEILPDYRLVPAVSHCDIQHGWNLQRNVPFPVMLLQDESLFKLFTQFGLIHSVSTLERLKEEPESNGDIIGKNMPPDFSSFITEQLKAQGNNMAVGNISIGTHRSSITQVLAEIRNKVLDLLLELEREFPELSKENSSTGELKPQVNEKINYIMNLYNINNSGSSGSTVNTGNKNQINSAQGENISQEILNNSAALNKIEDALQQIKDLIPLLQNQQEEAADLSLEVSRIDNQIQREKPNTGIVKQSFGVIFNILTSITANIYTEPVIQAVQGVLALL